MFTINHKVFLIESYFRNGVKLENGEWSYSLQPCIEEFRAEFPNFPTTYDSLRQLIQGSVVKFRETGSVSRKPGAGRPLKRTVENIADVEGRINQSPKKSIRKLSQQTQLSYGTCQRILKKDLQKFPYKFHCVQELLPIDHVTRINYCQWFLGTINNDDVLDKSFWSDEAWFHLSGYINKQTMRIWSSENPHEILETPLHSQKIGAWLAVSRRRIIGPIFFNNTINAERYRNNLLLPFVNQLHDDELRAGYFQQDNATAHKTRETMELLHEFFDNRIVDFPPRSPDLTIMDYFIYPHLKNRVFTNRPHTIEELTDAIRNVCEEITPHNLRNAFNNMRRRVTVCIENEGAHFEHLL